VTLKNMIEKARRLSRTGASVSDEIVKDWINEAMRQFVIDVGGITEVGELIIIGNSVTVPEHFFSLHHLFIGRNELRRGSMQILANADIEGTPEKYFLSASKILFDRKCSSPGMSARIIYDRFPVELALETDIPELPEKAHLALAYLSASKLSEENFEYDEATRALANYRNEIQRYLQDESNANPSIFGK